MINYKDFLKTVALFRDSSLRKYGGGIDLMPPKEREIRLGRLKVESDLTFSIMRSLVPRYREPIDSVSSLLKTPRLLKISLRRIFSAWKHLHGEIDFDDLFVMVVLRFAAPQAYDFLLENSGDIRALERSNNDSTVKSRAYLKNKWQRVIALVDWDVEAAERLIAFLFPGWDEKSFDLTQVPQGIRNTYPTDYWQRANAEFIPAPEIRDQEVLQALRRWKSEHEATVLRKLSLPQALYSVSSSASKLEQFALFFLDAKDIRRLAESLFKVILLNESVKANIDSCPGFASLWRLSTRTPLESEEEHRQWALKQIVTTLPLSLRFANDIYRHWRHNQYISASTKTLELRELVIADFKKLFLDKPESLIKSLDPSFMFSIYHFAILFSQPDSGGPGFQPVEWRWLAHLLLDAAKQQPQIVLPQIVPLILDSQVTMSFGRHFQFNKERANALFEARLRELMDLLIETAFDKYLDDDIAANISFAQQTAHEWLQGLTPS